MKCLCSLGFHSWNEWILWTVDSVDHQPRTYRRSCKYCGQVQKGNTKIVIVPITEGF